MTKAVVSVAPNFIGAVANSLYTKEMAAIAGRELLQNSLDACMRAGRNPEIEIKFRKINDQSFEVYCKDNGCGMEDWEITENFLGAGASSKGDVAYKAIGRFGVASTLIFMAKEFELRTHNWRLNQHMLRERADIEQTAVYVDGCEIWVTMPVRYWYHDAIRQMREFFFTSSFPMKSKITIEFDNCGNWDGKFQYPGYVPPVSKEIEYNEFGLMYSTPEIIVQNTDGKRFNLEICNVARINGLTQVVEGANVGRTTNLIYDVDPGKNEAPTFDSAEDKNDYPFNLSRESLKGDWKENFRHQSRLMDIDCLSAQIDLDLQSVPRVQLDRYFNTDNKAQGTRDRLANPQSTVANEVSEHEFQEIVNTVSMLESKVEQFTIKNDAPETVVTFDNVAFYIDAYYQKAPTDRARTWRVKHFSKVWFALIKICASRDEFFGIGFTGSPYKNADREYVSEGKGIFYLINVAALEAELKAGMSVEGLLLTMWGMACHVTAHDMNVSHDERFTTIEAAIQRNTASLFYKAMPSMLRTLKSGR